MVKETDYLISNQEILGGLKAAIERGSTLKQAMMTFYQAGYDKGEIEDAARAYMNQQKNQQEGVNPAQVVQKPQAKKEDKEEEKKEEKKPEPKEKSEPPKSPTPPTKPAAGAEKKKESPQKVSAYGAPKKKVINPPKSNTLTYILIFVLLLLVGVLVAVYLFKNELIDMINSMFN